jgi:RNA polymerase sigma-70 factor (ECF subfamily)
MADGNLDPEAFAQMTAALRPRLHRYCARMLGSAIDGEDVLQDALIKATEALTAAGPLERPENWLFRIAHNTALDALRRRKRMAERFAQAGGDTVAGPQTADVRVAAAGSFASFLRLPAAQRACVVLADVLGYGLDEIAQILDMTLAAVKAALHRGRARLKTLAETPEPTAAPLAGSELARLRAYADRFNARDFDALRDLLADDVRLDLANRVRLAGARDVGVYFTRYAGTEGWRFRVGRVEGRLALLVGGEADDLVRYVVLLDWRDGRIAAIRDFLYAPYVMEGLAVAEL